MSGMPGILTSETKKKKNYLEQKYLKYFFLIFLAF